MPVTPTYPGVYIEELPSGVRTITGVATSTAAFVDFFKRGPVDKAVRVLSYADFEREFGGLDSRSEASYAIQQFFLNGGSEAWVVRVVQQYAEAEKAATASVGIGADILPAATAPTVDAAGEAAGEAAPRTRRPSGRGGAQPRSEVLTEVLTVKAANHGSWGNELRLVIEPADATNAFNLVVSHFESEGDRSVLRQQEVYRSLLMDPAKPTFVKDVVNDPETGSKLVNIFVPVPDRDEATETNGNAVPLANGTLSGELASEGIPLPQHTSLRVAIGVADTPDWTTATITLTFRDGSGTPNRKLPEIAAALEAAIRAAKPESPAFAGASVQVANSRLWVRPGPTDPKATIQYEVVADDDKLKLSLTGVGGLKVNVAEYQLGVPEPLTGSAQVSGIIGRDGAAPDAQTLIGRPADKTGIYALEDVDLFNLLSIPRAALISDPGAQAVMSAAIQYCEQRRAFFLMDTPDGIDGPTEIATWLSLHDTLRSHNAALYYPRVRIPDPLNGFRLRSVGASGTVAGLYARTDSTRGVWKAPAGTDAALRNVTALADLLTDGENGTLNPIAINCLRSFPIFGNVAWGARTLDGADQKASEWKYVPVRRLALFLEESLYRGTKWVVFEPNDEPLWAQIRLNIGAFMQNLFRQGAFQGTTPRDAYFVKCDKETTIQNDINRGIVNIVVGFAPLKPAEFVIIRFQQVAGQIAT